MVSDILGFSGSLVFLHLSVVLRESLLHLDVLDVRCFSLLAIVIEPLALLNLKEQSPSVWKG